MTKQNLMRIGTSHLAFLLVPLATSLLGLSFSATAQQPGKVYRIGYLTAAPLSAFATRIEAFQQGLRDLGYVEGRNITVDYRFSDGNPTHEAELARELVRLNVDVIVVGAFPAIRAAKEATKTIPIVITATQDPVATGIVDSLARPGGNITGVSRLTRELSGKRLELLKESFPKVIRVAYLWNPDRPAIELKDMQNAARAMAVQLQSLEVRSGADFDRAFKIALRERSQALMTWTNPLFGTHRNRIIEFVTKNRLPAIFPSREFVDAGGLMSYAPDITAMFRRAAVYVDKILKGAKPADLPVEQPTKFEFVINLKVAKEIGVAIPPNVLARADKVIR